MKYFKHININITTFIKKVEGFKYFSNVFSVVGNNDSIIFISDTEEDMKKIEKEITELINQRKITEKRKALMSLKFN